MYSLTLLSGSILPTTVVQAEGLDATFLCQLLAGTGAIERQINGTPLHYVNISDGQIQRERRGEEIEALIVSALPQLNGTSVLCILYIIETNGTVTFIDSKPALLLIQGSLLACTMSQAYISWCLVAVGMCEHIYL